MRPDLRPLLIATALFAAAVLSPNPAFAADYVQAKGSTLTFATQYQGETFSGRFPSFATTLRFDPKQLATSKLDVTIPLTGFSTANKDRDDTLRGADFFNIAKFPTARYVATKFRSLGGNRYAADGTLTLRGVSRPVVLDFTWTPGKAPVLTGKATVKRLAFNIGGGDWADTELLPDNVAVSTRVVLQVRK